MKTSKITGTLLDWIKDRYGPVTFRKNGMLHAVAVPVMGGIAIGIGLDACGALLNLKEDLEVPIAKYPNPNRSQHDQRS